MLVLLVLMMMMRRRSRGSGFDHIQSRARVAEQKTHSEESPVGGAGPARPPAHAQEELREVRHRRELLHGLHALQARADLLIPGVTHFR